MERFEKGTEKKSLEIMRGAAAEVLNDTYYDDAMIRAVIDRYGHEFYLDIGDLQKRFNTASTREIEKNFYRSKLVNKWRKRLQDDVAADASSEQPSD